MNTKSFPEIKRKSFTTLQVNLGYKCNQACEHCHVNASPSRTEMMDNKVLSIIPRIIKAYEVKVLDITGGAPEMHPGFKTLVSQCSDLNIEIIDRCNLTILNEPGYEELPLFLSKNFVKVIASMPCYLEENVDKQRGDGVFKRSIYALKNLNKLGYGKKGTNLILNLVYNPQGDNLPPDQLELEEQYRVELLKRYGIEFNNLLVITNMPIKRFANKLRIEGKLNTYQNLLEDNFNPSTIGSLMCKETLSVDWEGNLYDCDFNQQLNLENSYLPKNINDLLLDEFNFKDIPITIRKHCFGCTAGSGSSCGGALTS